MCRDKNRDRDYFKEYIDKSKSRIEKFESWIVIGKTPEERIPIVLKSIGSIKLRILIAKYSLGNSTTEIEQDYLELLKKFDKYWPVGQVLMKHEGKELKQYLDYDDMLWMLSFGYLFNVSNQYFELLADLIDRDEVIDHLYEFILSRKLNREAKSQESYEYGWDLYKSLRQAIQVDQSQIDSIKLVAVHLEKEWKKDHKEMLKSIESKNPIYYGAWSFESVSIVAILGLDDSTFKDNQYYPKDLLDHYRSTLKGLPS